MVRKARLVSIVVSLFGVLTIGAGRAQAYPQYSVNGDDTNCRACHGDFRANPYVSLTEGADWGKSLMDMHANDILNGDCATCHGSGPRFPVMIGSSAGGDGLEPIACAGCHGRAEDADPQGSGSQGYGAGLRQHHWVANRVINGISTRICANCHIDASPATYDTADESYLPPYYAFPAGSDTAHPDIPSDPCNPAADGYPESYAGSSEGLDNDGDGLYDEADTNDPIPCPEPGQVAILLTGIGMLLGIERQRK